MRAAVLVVLMSSLGAQDPAPAAAPPAPIAATGKLPDALILGACFPAPRVGIVVGGRRETDPAVVMRTEDDGATWTAAQVPSPTARLYDVQFPTPQLGFACGLQGLLLRTTDTGRVWEAVPTPFGHTWFAAVQFLDAERGFLAGSKEGPLLACTSDGGKTWERVRVPGLAAEGDVRDVCFVDALLGLACGSNGLLLRTEDGGKSWQKIATGSTAWLRPLLVRRRAERFRDQRRWLPARDEGWRQELGDARPFRRQGQRHRVRRREARPRRHDGRCAVPHRELRRVVRPAAAVNGELTVVVPLGKDGWWVFGSRGQAIRLPGRHLGSLTGCPWLLGTVHHAAISSTCLAAAP
jgi:photosystem II stability/assembly factor-like uncharacterized protein